MESLLIDWLFSIAVVACRVQSLSGCPSVSILLQQRSGADNTRISASSLINVSHPPASNRELSIFLQIETFIPRWVVASLSRPTRQLAAPEDEWLAVTLADWQPEHLIKNWLLSVLVADVVVLENWHSPRDFLWFLQLGGKTNRSQLTPAPATGRVSQSGSPEDLASHPQFGSWRVGDCGYCRICMESASVIDGCQMLSTIWLKSLRKVKDVQCWDHF